MALVAPDIVSLSLGGSIRYAASSSAASGTRISRPRTRKMETNAPASAIAAPAQRPLPSPAVNADGSATRRASSRSALTPCRLNGQRCNDVYVAAAAAARRPGGGGGGDRGRGERRG